MVMRTMAVLCGVMGLLAPVPARGDGSDESRWALVESLRKPIDFQGFDDVKTPLQEALDMLGKRYGTTFHVNERAFRDESVEGVLRTEIASPTPVPPMPGARYQTVLQCLLERIPSPSGATFLIRSDRIEITTNAAARAEIWGEDHDGPFLPLVHVKARSQPLGDVLASVADRATLNIVVDPRAKEKAATKLNARLLNTPADTALDLLADMAGLKVVRVRNVHYVTTPERAAEMRKELETPARKGDRKPVSQPAGPGTANPK